MKFKVGDKVKFIKKIIHHNVGTGGIFTITHIDENDQSFQYLAESKKGNKEWFKEEELQKVEYTYKDLDKLPVGTKVIDKYGNSYIKVYENKYKQISDKNEWFYLIDRYSKKSFSENINKIEVPEYKTYYDQKKEILDEVEKRYLRGVIRPFKENVRFITKRRYWIDSTEYNDISICIRNNSNIILPKFKANKMYKGMEMEKTYTLEELGL